MEGIKKVVVALCLVLGLAGCTCTLASCGSDEAQWEAQWSQRFEVSRGTIHGGSFDIDHMIVNTVTDTETGQKWLVVTTNHGAAIAPIDEKE